MVLADDGGSDDSARAEVCQRFARLGIIRRKPLPQLRDRAAALSRECKLRRDQLRQPAVEQDLQRFTLGASPHCCRRRGGRRQLRRPRRAIAQPGNPGKLRRLNRQWPTQASNRAHLRVLSGPCWWPARGSNQPVGGSTSITVVGPPAYDRAGDEALRALFNWGLWVGPRIALW